MRFSVQTGTAVCHKCIELDEKIEHYRWISRSINDRLTIDRIEGLIKDLQDQKVALHAAPNEPKE